MPMLKSVLTLVLLMVSASGCFSTYAVNRYGISVDNIVALREMNAGSVQVGRFTASQPGLKEIMCRAVGPIKTPDNETYADYVRKALLDDLRMANKHASSSPVTLTGNLDAIIFNPAMGVWTLGLTIQSSNGHWIRESRPSVFTASHSGETACGQTAQAFMPAVQDLLGHVIRSPAFPRLMAAPLDPSIVMPPEEPTPTGPGS